MHEDVPQGDHDLRGACNGLHPGVERSFAWLTRGQWLTKDDERLPQIVAALLLAAFATLKLGRMVKLRLGQSA